MAAAFARQAILRSMQCRTPLPPVSPKKSQHRQISSTGPTRNASRVKGSRKSKAKVKKSHSDSGLVSSFRNLSISPCPSPPQRGKSVSPQKRKHGGRTRHRSLSSFSVSSIQDIANLIKEEKCKNIIVMAGAGISTPSGIPDFRSPGTGLYDNIQQYKIPEPSAIFDIEYFWYNPRPFFRLAKTLYPGNYKPNYVHHFVKLLHDKGLLLRMYTQNIDGLERLAGIPESKLVEAHGTFSTASCIRCHKSYDGEKIRKIIMNDEIPVCLSPRCKGMIKPNIVFFGEDLPKKFFSYVVDFPKCDLLLVMGTSLEVEPFAGIARAVSRDTPRLLINRDLVGPFASISEKRSNDFVLKGDIVEGVRELAKLLEWKEAVEEIASDAEQSWKSNACGGFAASEVESQPDRPKNDEGRNPSETRAKAASSVENVESPKLRSYHTFTGASPVDVQQSPAGFKVTHPTSRAESLSRPNSVARQVPLLPFRLSRRNDGPSLQGDFKAIDPNKDLASAGIGLSKVRNSNK